MLNRTFLALLCVGALGAQAVARADQVQYLDRGDVAISRLYDDIRNAKDSVDISYYIWVPCSDSTKALVNLLAEKKRKNPNFRARLLLDGSGVQMNEQTTYLEKRGIEVKFFNERMKFDVRRNMRTHVKATIVDGKRYVTGGRNIADDYFGMQDGLNWVDRDIAVVGSSARQMKAGFDRLWENRDSKRLEPASEADTAAFERSCIDGQRDELEEKETPAQLAKKNREKKARFKKVEEYLRQNSARIVKAAPTHNCPDVRAYFDDMTHGDVLPDRADDSSQKDYLSGERLARKVSTAALLKFLDDPELRNLSMENYSYIPPGKVDASLQAIRARKGSQVNLYTNIFHKSGEPIDDVSNYYVRRDKRAGQVSYGMRKYTGPAFNWALTTREQDYAIHSKVYVANTKDTFVSSFNVDPRSYHTNGESAVWVKNCPALAKQVENEMRRLGAIALEQNLLRNCGPEAEEVIDSIGGVDGIMNWMKHEFL